MQTIHDTLDHVRLGEAAAFEGMTVFPLFSDRVYEKDYLTLDEALATEKARVREVSEEGDVPSLRFDNPGDSRVLLVDGDELVGARQNRIINLSILVPAHASLEIPVSCVEAGRWSYRDKEFRSAKRSMYAQARANKAESVTVRMRRSGERRSDQTEVWSNIAACACLLDVASSTGAMADLYENSEARLGRYRQAFTAADGQVGALFAIGGKVQGLELFDCSATFGRYLERLVSSYALWTPSGGNGSGQAGTEQAEQFLEAVKRAKTERFAALGEGEDLRLSGEALTGGALLAADRVVHLAAFRLDRDDRDMQPSPRRRFTGL